MCEWRDSGNNTSDRGQGGGGISIHYTYFMFSTDAATHFHRIHNGGNLTRLMTPLLQNIGDPRKISGYLHHTQDTNYIDM